MTIYQIRKLSAKITEESPVSVFDCLGVDIGAKSPSNLKTGLIRSADGAWVLVGIEEDSPETVNEVYALLETYGLLEKSKIQPSDFIIEKTFEEDNYKELVENILVQIVSLDQSISETQYSIERLKLDTRDILTRLEKI